MTREQRIAALKSAVKKHPHHRRRHGHHDPREKLDEAGYRGNALPISPSRAGQQRLLVLTQPR